MIIFPLSAVSKVPKICNRVDFPAPEAPTMQVISLLFMVMSTPLRTSTLPKDLCMLFALIMFDFFANLKNLLLLLIKK